MALVFTSVDNSAISFNTSGLRDFPYGTSAAVVYLPSNVNNPGGGYSVIFIGTGPNADVIDIINIYNTPTNAPGYWNSDGSDAIAAAGITAARWFLVCVGKDTGNVAPRVHYFDFTTGTWTHANATSSIVDSTATAQTNYSIGGYITGGGSFNFAGEIACTGAWYKRLLSDAEVERLAGGNWQRYSPDTLCEFRSSNRTPFGAGPADHGRERMAMATFGTAITRSARVDPPGFRWSPMARRR